MKILVLVSLFSPLTALAQTAVPNFDQLRAIQATAASPEQFAKILNSARDTAQSNDAKEEPSQRAVTDQPESPTPADDRATE